MNDIMTSDVLIGVIADFPDGEIRSAAMPDGSTLAVYNVDGTRRRYRKKAS
jgi:p-cumate 2,3-dioxygenase ferredoxin component